MDDVGKRFIASTPAVGTPVSVPTPVVGARPGSFTGARNSAALVVCAFGWGKEFRLYTDYLVVDGKRYRLQELIDIHSTCRTVLGVPSASLELRFRSAKKLTLRGIAALDDARKVVEYLTPWCKPLDVTFHERDTHPLETPLPGSSRGWQARKGQSWRLPETGKQCARVDTMPVVPVPVRLARGEVAHYSTPATLCGEHIAETSRYTYPAQDHGLLILTGRRIIYIGRKSQLVLDYPRLMHVSRLRGAIAFEAEHWEKRVIFEVPRPDECAACVETILHTIKQEETGMIEYQKAGRPPGSPLPYYETNSEARIW